MTLKGRVKIRTQSPVSETSHPRPTDVAPSTHVTQLSFSERHARPQNLPACSFLQTTAIAFLQVELPQKFLCHLLVRPGVSLDACEADTRKVVHALHLADFQREHNIGFALGLWHRGLDNKPLFFDFAVLFPQHAENLLVHLSRFLGRCRRDVEQTLDLARLGQHPAASTKHAPKQRPKTASQRPSVKAAAERCRLRSSCGCRGRTGSAAVRTWRSKLWVAAKSLHRRCFFWKCVKAVAGHNAVRRPAALCQVARGRLCRRGELANGNGSSSWASLWSTFRWGYWFCNLKVLGADGECFAAAKTIPSLGQRRPAIRDAERRVKRHGFGSKLSLCRGKPDVAALALAQAQQLVIGRHRVVIPRGERLLHCFRVDRVKLCHLGYNCRVQVKLAQLLCALPRHGLVRDTVQQPRVLEQLVHG
eukprot:m.480196 g.480196  ORF g.480196 m.480196 type:complete len:419 (-) comp21736_c0_seq1:1229-2485(-)